MESFRRTLKTISAYLYKQYWLKCLDLQKKYPSRDTVSLTCISPHAINEGWWKKRQIFLENGQTSSGRLAHLFSSSRFFAQYTNIGPLHIFSPFHFYLFRFCWNMCTFLLPFQQPSTLTNFRKSFANTLSSCSVLSYIQTVGAPIYYWTSFS
jgi:hypothetical protein